MKTPVELAFMTFSAALLICSTTMASGQGQDGHAEFRRNDRPYPVGMTEAVSWQ